CRRSARAGRCPACGARTRSCGQLLPPGWWNRDWLAALVVVGNEHGLRLGHERVANAQLVLEVEALLAEAADADADLHLVAEPDGRAEVDLDPRHNDRQVLEG